MSEIIEKYMRFSAPRLAPNELRKPPPSPLLAPCVASNPFALLLPPSPSYLGHSGSRLYGTSTPTSLTNPNATPKVGESEVAPHPPSHPGERRQAQGGQGSYLLVLHRRRHFL